MATLSQGVSRWRRKLNDTVPDSTGSYLWTNEEFTEYYNTISDMLCTEIGLIYDTTTASICQVTVATDDTVLTVSDRIISIERAKLTSQTTLLGIVSSGWMDGNVSDWENEDSNTVKYLIKTGIGNNKVRLYPPSDQDDTLNLGVFRLQLADLDWSTDQATVLEIPTKYHNVLDNGICWMAYGKHDVDTEEGSKAKDYYALFRRDVDNIKWGQIKAGWYDRAVTPHLGAM